MVEQSTSDMVGAQAMEIVRLRNELCEATEALSETKAVLAAIPAIDEWAPKNLGAALVRLQRIGVKPVWSGRAIVGWSTKAK